MTCVPRQSATDEGHGRLVARPRSGNVRGVRRAFTLVEIMVCLVIAAALAGLVVVNLRAARHDLSVESAMAEWEATDRLMRDRCRQWQRPGELVVDFDTGEASRGEVGRDGTERIVAIPGLSGGQTRVTAVHGVKGQTSEGVVRLSCSPAGRTRSYAVRISDGTSQRWLVAAGLTGKFQTIEDDADVEDIFRQLAASAAPPPRQTGDDPR